jgi:hypothetical protein
MIQPALAADGWLSEYKFKQQLKKMKRSKMRPTSVSCRKTGKGGLKAEIKAIWKPDDGKKTWQLYAFHGDLDWRPGPPEQWNKWKRVSYTTLRGRGGAKYRCALYEKK